MIFLSDGWRISKRTNCYTGVGATSIQPNPWEANKGLDSCKYACFKHPDCEAIIWGKETCHLRKDLQKKQCRPNPTVDLLEKPKGKKSVKKKPYKLSQAMNTFIEIQFQKYKKFLKTA